MYELRDNNGHFLCYIDTSETNRVILRDTNRRSIGYGEEETHFIHVGSIVLYLDDGTKLGTLDREYGEGKNDYVVFSCPQFTKRIPVAEFTCPYIVGFLFGWHSDSYKIYQGQVNSDQRKENKPGTPPTPPDPEWSGFRMALLTVLSLILCAGAIIGYIKVYKMVQLNNNAAFQVLTTIVPCMFGVIPLMMCLFHRNGGAGMRIAGIVEGVCTAALIGIILRAPLVDETDPIGVFFDIVKKLVPGSEASGFLQVVIGLLAAVLFFLMLFMLFAILAALFQLSAAFVKGKEQKKWIKDKNRKFHKTAFCICAVLVVAEIMLFSGEKIFATILLGIFCGALAIPAFIIVTLISRAILR